MVQGTRTAECARGDDGMCIVDVCLVHLAGYKRRAAALDAACQPGATSFPRVVVCCSCQPGPATVLLAARVGRKAPKFAPVGRTIGRLGRGPFPGPRLFSSPLPPLNSTSKLHNSHNSHTHTFIDDMSLLIGTTTPPLSLVCWPWPLLNGL